MDEWFAFSNAITANDAAKVIAIATPKFVKAHPNCFHHFCSFHIDFGFTGDEMVVTHLLANGAKWSENMLFKSMYCRRPKLTKALLKHGFNANIHDAHGMTPLDLLSVLNVGFGTYAALRVILIDAGGELFTKQAFGIQDLIDFRKNARIACITCIGIGRKRREGRDVFAIIARIVWGERIKRFI